MRWVGALPVVAVLWAGGAVAQQDATCRDEFIRLRKDLAERFAEARAASPQDRCEAIGSLAEASAGLVRYAIANAAAPCRISEGAVRQVKAHNERLADLQRFACKPNLMRIADPAVREPADVRSCAATPDCSDP
jgi:hypothetical protein